jgi:hypothetical protein
MLVLSALLLGLLGKCPTNDQELAMANMDAATIVTIVIVSG